MILFRYFALILLTVSLAGCVPLGPQPTGLEEQQKALALIDQGTAYLRAGALDEAKAAFEISYDLQVSAAAMDGLGCVAFHTGDLEAAREYFLGAYRFAPDYSPSLTHLALLYDYIGATEEAYELHARALQEEPDLIEARNNMAVILGEQGDSLEAKQELLRAFVVQPHRVLGKNLEAIGVSPWQQ